MTLRFLSKRETVVSGVGIALLATAAVSIPASAVSPGRVKPANTGVYAQAVAGSYVLGASNTDSSDPFNDYAVEGEVPNDVGGVGVLGYASQAKSYAVYGVTFGSNGIGVYGAGDGPTPAPAATPSSAQQSTGVVGNSASGQGVFGSTEFPNANAGYVSNPAAGVEGVDATTKGGLDNVGVAGMTTNGAYGVEGISGTNAIGGVLGYGTNGSGVFGYSASRDAVVGITGSQPVNGYGYAGGYFNGPYLSLIAQAGTASGSSTISYPIDVEDSTGAGIFYINNSGDTYIHGELFLHDGQGTYARTRDPQKDVKAFTASTTHPTSEDFGEAQLVGGQTYIHLDPTFAQSIDSGSPYLVFVTPEGDTKGLYVTQKSMTGFAVRETQGGHSNLTFSYRIVAVQYGMSNRRMALVDANAFEGPRRGGSLAAAQESARLANMVRGVRSAQPLRIVRPSPNLAVERRGAQ